MCVYVCVCVCGGREGEGRECVRTHAHVCASTVCASRK